MSKIATNTNFVLIPSDLKSFLYNYQNSKFIECDRNLVKRNKNSFYEQNVTKNERMMSSFRYFTNYLESIHMNYWLFGGTLLG